MLITYINTSGNFQQLETLTDPKWETKLEKNGNVWFERKSQVAEKVKAPKVEVKEEVIAITESDIGETVVEVTDVEVSDDQYKSFLKEKKVRGYGLLKGEALKNKAISEGFKS